MAKCLHTTVPRDTFLHWFSFETLCSQQKETVFRIAKRRSIYIYTKLKFPALQGAPYIYDITRLRVKGGKIWKGHDLCWILSAHICKNTCVNAFCLCVCECVCSCVLVWGGNVTKKLSHCLICYSQFSFLSFCPKPSQSRLHKEKFEIHFLSYYVQTTYTKTDEEV
jgi:hypothetical protein